MVIRKDTFYFLKVELGIDNCEEVAAVERMKHGPEYLWLWIRLALKYTNYDGVLCRRVGDEVYPVSPDDLEAEMHGAFSDVSIKDGIAVLLKAKLIYINSEGFMAITGLTISGDPLEPILHKQNSNRTDIRPLSVGNDSKTAAYHRAYRARIKEREQQKLIGTQSTQMMSYSDIAKKASCAKQTVSNWIRKLNLEDRTFLDGQKKMVPENIAKYLICCIKGTKVPESILDSLRLDGLDGLRPPSNTVQIPSSEPSKSVQQPSKKNGEPSNTHEENTDKISTLDGFANANMDANMDAILDANIPLFENNRILEIDDDISNIRKSVQNRPNLYELFAVGFDRKPDASDLAMLADLYEHTDYDLLLLSLKKARKYKAESMVYVKKCVDYINSSGNDTDLQNNPDTHVDPDRDLSDLLSICQSNYIPSETGNDIQETLDTFENLAKYYSDIELLRIIKCATIYQDFRPDSLKFFSKFCASEWNDDLEMKYSRFLQVISPHESLYTRL